MNEPLPHSTKAVDSPQRQRERSRRAGIVLIIVMVVVVMISLAGFGFVASISNENRVVHLRGEQMQMQNALASAEEFLKQHLSQPPSTESSPVTPDEEQELMRGVVVADEPRPNSRVRFTVMAPYYDDGSSAKWHYGLLRESGRLDLRSVLNWENRQAGLGRKSLMTLPGMTEAIADALLDWMDRDKTPRPAGAEDEYYASLTPPYSPRNGIPISLEELLLVKGVTRSLLYGQDANQNHRLDLDEQSFGRDSVQQDATGEKQIPWIELLTLCSQERNVSASGHPRINLNHFDLRQMHRQLSEAIDPAFATFVVLYRQYGPDTGNGKSIDPKSVKLEFHLPARFPVRSILDLVGCRVRIASPVGGAAHVDSPLKGESEKLEKSLATLWDRVTVSPEPILKGLVNINQAPTEVLQAIPGMEKGLADQIVTARSSTTKKDRSHDEHPCWLLTEGLVDLNKMRQLAPYLTVGGDVYRTQVIAFSEASRLSQRVELVLDASRRPVRRVYWKDLQVLGRGYPWDVIDTPGGTSRTPTGRTPIAGTPAGNARSGNTQSGNTQTGAFNATPLGN